MNESKDGRRKIKINSIPNFRFKPQDAVQYRPFNPRTMSLRIIPFVELFNWNDFFITFNFNILASVSVCRSRVPNELRNQYFCFIFSQSNSKFWPRKFCLNSYVVNKSSYANIIKFLKLKWFRNVSVAAVQMTTYTFHVFMLCVHKDFIWKKNYSNCLNCFVHFVVCNLQHIFRGERFHWFHLYDSRMVIVWQIRNDFRSAIET